MHIFTIAILFLAKKNNSFFETKIEFFLKYWMYFLAYFKCIGKTRCWNQIRNSILCVSCVKLKTKYSFRNSPFAIKFRRHIHCCVHASRVPFKDSHLSVEILSEGHNDILEKKLIVLNRKITNFTWKENSGQECIQIRNCDETKAFSVFFFFFSSFFFVFYEFFVGEAWNRLTVCAVEVPQTTKYYTFSVNTCGLPTNVYL